MSASIGAPPGFIEVIHGVPVADPYRWLEDRASLETEHWISQQRIRIEEYRQSLGSLESLRKRVEEFVDVETIDQIGKVQNRYFYRRRDVGQEQASIFVKDSALQPERLLVGPSDQSPFEAIGIYGISSDASLLAYEVKHGGEHAKAIHLVDVNTGSPLPDHLGRGLARGLIIRNENDGFYYCHEFSADPTALKKDHEVRFHRLGTPIADDLSLLTLERTRSSKVVLTHGGEMLGASYFQERSGSPAVDFYITNQAKHGIWNCVCRSEPAPFIPFIYRGRLFAHRFHGKPNGEIVELDPTNGQVISLVVPEWHTRISQCSIAEDHLFVRYLADTGTVVRIWTIDGEFLGKVPLEEGNTWGLVPGYTSETDEIFLHCESFLQSPTLIRYQPQMGEQTVFSRRHAPNSPARFAARKLSYLSRDGTEVALSLLGPEDEALLKERPVIMTAYGGFGVPMVPLYSTFVSLMLELGFLFALPQIRGGGERGNLWHQAARGRNRQVAFDDFIAAGDWLCEKGFSNPQKLAIFGGSNSGLLIGAAITQRPDLFRAALCIAPLLDMVRYHQFDRALVWAEEYGTADDPEDFRALHAYSPYHRVREEINYPATLFVSGDRDTRCNPAHARKMAARLQQRSAQISPILLDHSVERGHAATLPLSARVKSLTLRIAFLCHELGVPILFGETQ